MGKKKGMKVEDNKDVMKTEGKVQKRNGSFKNKEKVLVVSSRGITFRCGTLGCRGEVTCSVFNIVFCLWEKVVDRLFYEVVSVRGLISSFYFYCEVEGLGNPKMRFGCDVPHLVCIRGEFAVQAKCVSMVGEVC